MNEKIYLVLVKTEKCYEHPDWGWHGMVHDLSLAGAYTDLNDAKKKKDLLIEEGVWYGSIEIQPVDINVNMNQDDFICLYETVEYE